MVDGSRSSPDPALEPMLDSEDHVVDRDSGIHADNDIAEPVTELTKYAEGADPMEDVVYHNLRRGSIASRCSEAPSLLIDPKDELCGWGPFSPNICQQFRNPKWVLVWLSLAGVCQVCAL